MTALALFVSAFEIADRKTIVRTMHGLSGHILYTRWKQMICRCYSQSASHFTYYGGRGIRVCKRWMDFRNFLLDMEPKYLAGLSIDRINSNGHYTPDNCRWATRQTQSINKRNVRFIDLNGENIALVTIAKKSGLHPETISIRMKRGMGQSAAISLPAKSNPKPRPVFIDGVIYNSLTAAGASLDLTKQAIYLRIKRGQARYLDV